MAAAEPLIRRVAEILLKFTRATGYLHPQLQGAINDYAGLLGAMGHSRYQIMVTLHEMAPEFF
jgi:hypothetical protein